MRRRSPDCSPGTLQPCHIGGVLLSGPGEVNLSMTQAIIFIAIAVAVCVLVGFVAALLGRRSGRRAISQRLASLGTRLGLDPPEDEYNVETSLAYLEQVTGGAAQAVTESSSDAIRLRRSLDTLTQGVVLCDENGTVIYRNGTGQRPDGQPPRRRPGRPGGDRRPRGRLARGIGRAHPRSLRPAPAHAAGTRPPDRRRAPAARGHRPH